MDRILQQFERVVDYGEKRVYESRRRTRHEKSKLIWLHKQGGVFYTPTKQRKMNKLTVEAIEHVSVRGKSLWYLKLRNDAGAEHVMNVGESTVVLVRQLLEGKGDEMPLSNAEGHATKEEAKRKR